MASSAQVLVPRGCPASIEGPGLSAPRRPLLAGATAWERLRFRLSTFGVVSDCSAWAPPSLGSCRLTSERVRPSRSEIFGSMRYSCSEISRLDRRWLLSAMQPVPTNPDHASNNVLQAGSMRTRKRHSNRSIEAISPSVADPCARRVLVRRSDRLLPGDARLLGPLLDDFARRYDPKPRLQFDPLEFPRRYTDPADVEVTGLIAASLAYGRADLFKPRIERILEVTGSSPAAFVDAFWRRPDARVFQGIRYRFNEPDDFAALVAAIGWMRSTHGSLGARFGALRGECGDLRTTLARFAEELRLAPPVAPLLQTRGPRGLRHLLPDARLPGACKRWHLYLRWMCRGPDSIDLGIWDYVPTSDLLIPLDTHIARVALYLGLTRRTDLTWRTAEEITDALRRIDPVDPVRFDFALCHLAMSGQCAPAKNPAGCVRCSLLRACSAGTESLRTRPAKSDGVACRSDGPTKPPRSKRTTKDGIDASSTWPGQ